MKSLLVMDWLAKLCLLLPVYLAGKNPGTMVGCLAVGLLLWLWFSVLISGVSEESGDFFDLTAGRMGKICAWIVYLTGFFYFLSHAAVCINLCANLAAVYLLPEVPLPVLALLPLAAGLYLAYSRVEVHGRLGELLAPVIVLLFLLSAAFAVPGMNLTAGDQMLLRADQKLAAGSYEVFACMGGMFLPILMPFLTNQKQDIGALIRRAGCWSLIPAGILLFITAGSFGAASMFAFEFPTVRVMSNVNVPGGFLQRWDIFFLILLMFSLSFSVGNGFWYLNEIIERLWQEAVEVRHWLAVSLSDKGGKAAQGSNAAVQMWKTGDTADQMRPGGNTAAQMWQEEFARELTGFEKKHNMMPYFVQGLSIFAVFCAAGGFRDSETAISYYRAYNLYILTPVMIFVYLLLYFRKKQKSVRVTALFMVLCMLLSGCTAKELEDRMFPMALELQVEGDHLAMTYAWSGDRASGSGGGAREEEKESESESGAESGSGSEASDSESGAASEPESGAESGAGSEPESGLSSENEQSRVTDSVSFTEEPEERGNLTVFRGVSLEEIGKQVEEYSDRYVDYSHVKALIIDENLEKYPELEQEMYAWLAGEPAFAASLIIYPAQKSGISLVQVDERSDGQIGVYLENLYENNQKLREVSTTLGKMTAEYYG